MAKMKLNAHERLGLLNILPQKGSLEQQMSVMEVVKKVSLTFPERDAIEYKLAGGGTFSYNKDKAEGLEKEIDFSDIERMLLKDEVDTLSKKGEITQATLAICTKIKGS